MASTAIMDVCIKVVISVDDNVFAMELLFNIFQRNVFADRILNVYVFTSETNEVKILAENIEKCCFSNMNGNIIYLLVLNYYIHFIAENSYYYYFFV